MSKKRLIIVCLIFLLGGCCWGIYESSNERINQRAERNQFNNIEAREMLRAASEMARLAPLPREHKNFRAYTSGNMFTRSFFITFQASAVDIQTFISDSEGLDPEPYQVYSLELPRICFDSIQEYDQFEAEGRQSLQSLCFRDEHWPEWWNPEIKESGRSFKIQPPRANSAGIIYVNDQTGQVYIDVWWS